MSRARNLSEVDLKPNSAYKTKIRQSIDQRRGILQPKVNRESPYSKIPKISKTRSIASFKTKTKNQSNSPKLSKNTSTNSSMINISSREIARNYSQKSISESYRSLYKDHAVKINHSYKNSNDHQNFSICGIDFEEKIQAITKLSLEERYAECNKLFEEVLEKDFVYGRVLRKIKDTIDEWNSLKDRKNQESLETVKKQFNETFTKLNCMIDDRKFLDRRMQQISQENIDLGKALEEAEMNLGDLEDKLIKITNFRLENNDFNQNTWKALVLENQSYSEVCKKMKKDIKNYKAKEKKLLKLVLAMKKRGYPIEEVYNKDVYGITDEYEENSESDRILSGRASEVQKPSNVPALRIDKLEPESFTSSSCSSFVYQTP